MREENTSSGRLQLDLFCDDMTKLTEPTRHRWMLTLYILVHQLLQVLAPAQGLLWLAQSASYLFDVSALDWPRTGLLWYQAYILYVGLQLQGAL